jgi:hypothetical protein
MPRQTYLVRHDITQQHDVSWINTHTVRLHGMLNLVVDGPAGSFDPEDFGSLHDVIRPRL